MHAQLKSSTLDQTAVLQPRGLRVLECYLSPKGIGQEGLAGRYSGLFEVQGRVPGSGKNRGVGYERGVVMDWGQAAAATAPQRRAAALSN